MNRITSIILTLIFAIYSGVLSAQCSMCKAVAESNSSGGGSIAEGLNSGILFLMAVPYVLIAGVAYMWYKHSKTSSVK